MLLLLLSNRSLIHETTGQTLVSIGFRRELSFPADLISSRLPDQPTATEGCVKIERKFD